MAVRGLSRHHSLLCARLSFPFLWVVRAFFLFPFNPLSAIFRSPHRCRHSVPAGPTRTKSTPILAPISILSALGPRAKFCDRSRICGQRLTSFLLNLSVLAFNRLSRSFFLSSWRPPLLIVGGDQGNVAVCTEAQDYTWLFCVVCVIFDGALSPPPAPPPSAGDVLAV